MIHNALTKSSRSWLSSKNSRLAILSYSRHKSTSAFPLQRPSWKVKELLEKPSSASDLPTPIYEPLNEDNIRHLYNLAGLQMDNVESKLPSSKIDHITKEINQLRDFLSHIQSISSSKDLDSVDPVLRMVEPLEFTIESPDAGLDFAHTDKDDLGRRVLQTASKTNGDYLIVEE